MKKTCVLYHRDADGFGAAYALWTRLKDAAHYISVQYSEPVPEIPEGVEHLYIVDFSYKREVCEDLAQKYNLVILDHHKTAEQELAGLPFAYFDAELSGAVMAWEFAHGPTDGPFYRPEPAILQYVQDRDLWRWDLPDSEEINLFIATLPFDFKVWDLHASNDTAFMDLAKRSGTAIKAFREQQITSALKNVRMMHFAGYEVPVLNISDNISEIGNELCSLYPDAPFSASYCDRKDARSWSLRSIGDFDVSELARQMGGGGHKNAAGFSTPLGWPEMQAAEFCEEFERVSK